MGSTASSRRALARGVCVLLCVSTGCAPRVEDTLYFANLDVARAHPIFSRVAFLAWLPETTRSLALVFDEETLERCARSRFSPESAPALRASLLDSGFDLYGGPAVIPPNGCPFRARDIRGGPVFRNSEADDEVPAIAVLDKRGRFFFWWGAAVPAGSQEDPAEPATTRPGRIRSAKLGGRT